MNALRPLLVLPALFGLLRGQSTTDALHYKLEIELLFTTQTVTATNTATFKSLTDKAVPVVTEKGLLITSFAICGFANFSSVGMQIGGIGELAPERRADLAQLGLKALFCGTLASYLSASIAGIIM